MARTGRPSRASDDLMDTQALLMDAAAGRPIPPSVAERHLDHLRRVQEHLATRTCDACGSKIPPAPSRPAARRSHTPRHAHARVAAMVGWLAGVRVKTVLAAASLVVLLSPAAASALTHNDHLSREVERIAGRPATVFCADNWDEWQADPWTNHGGASGVTDPTAGVVKLDPGVCYGLLDATDPLNTGPAALVLAHEAMHVRYPTASEALTECRAYQHVRRVIAWLDAPHPVAAMRQARRAHRDLLSVPGYNWKGLC
jgi:hypothetical protein